MQFTPSAEQRRALEDIDAFRNDPNRKVFRLFGGPGVGKTTIMQILATKDKSVLFVAPTNKAASVLQQKGCPHATTVHKLLFTPDLLRKRAELEKLEDELKKLTEYYTSKNRDPRTESFWKEQSKTVRAKQDAFAKLRFIQKRADNAIGQLVVVDEASMIGEEIGRELERVCQKLLIVGDPDQLPPVSEGPIIAAAYFMQVMPDITLREVHRQAADSPIIKMATLIRACKPLAHGKYGDCQVIDSRVDPREACNINLLNYDVVITPTNETRQVINEQIRKKKGICSDFPVPGEIIVAMTSWYGLRHIDIAIKNGDQFKVISCITPPESTELPRKDRWVVLQLETLGAHPRKFTLKAWAWDFLGIEKKDRKRSDMFDHALFAFTYAITGHKAQGSEWDRVLIIYKESDLVWLEKKARENGGGQSPWLYTSVTRAKKHLTVWRTS